MTLIFCLSFYIDIDIKGLMLCRLRDDTRPCIGRVQLFVKATLKRVPAATRAAHALGIAQGPHRFAIVKAWEASSDCQKGISEKDAQKQWAKAAAAALKTSKVFPDRDRSVKSLFKAVHEGARLFSVPKQGAEVRLKHGQKAGGVLDVLAVPVSSLYARYYHRESHQSDNWAVHPMVSVVKERSKIVIQPTGAMNAAINRMRPVRWFFLHTYSCSNTKL